MSHVQVIRDPAVGGDVPGLHALPGPRQPGGHAARHQRGKVRHCNIYLIVSTFFVNAKSHWPLKYGLCRDYESLNVSHFIVKYVDSREKYLLRNVLQSDVFSNQYLCLDYEVMSVVCPGWSRPTTARVRCTG